jgi:chromosome segregation ATPase
MKETSELSYILEHRLNSLDSALAKYIDRSEFSLTRIENRLDSIEQRLVQHSALLDEHIRRTNILEEKVIPLEKEWAKTKTILYVAAVLLGSTGLLGSFGKSIYNLIVGGIP